jgi:hypothetical protein
VRDLPPIKENDTLPKLDKIAQLEAQIVSLSADVAALKALQPPPEKLLTEADMVHYGHKRPNLSIPDESWLPSFQECANLALVVEKRFPYLVTRSDDWIIQFRRALLALGNCNRAPEPNNREWGQWIGEWLEDRLIWGGVERGPFLAAIAASGDIKFSGFGEKDALRGIMPMAGLAPRHSGTAPDRSAWRKVLETGRLTGEAASQQVNQGRPDRWDNPRSHVELLPQYDRR